MPNVLQRIWRRGPDPIGLSENGTCALLLLARPDATAYEYGSMVESLRADGTRPGVRLRPTPQGMYCVELEQFRGRLEMGGWDRAPEELTDLLSTMLLDTHVHEPAALERASKTLGLPYLPVVQRAYETMERERIGLPRD